MHVFPPDEAPLRAGRAVLRILTALGYGPLGWASWPPFIWAIELGYEIVARNRRFFSRFLFRDQ